MTVAFVVDYSWLSLLRHWAYQSHAFDLANMDQAVWNTFHGRILRFTDMQQGSVVLTNRLAIHVEPLLFLLAPLYILHSGPETLLVAQAAIAAFGAVPAYLLARESLGHDWLSLVFPLAYLLHPSLQSAVLDDFHAVTLSSCFLLWALYFLWHNSLRGFLPFAVLSAATKEEVGLLIAATGLVFLARRRFIAGLSIMTGGALWFLVSVGWIIPHFNPRSHSPYLGRYGYLGHGLIGVLTSPVRHPGVVLDVLASTSRLDYLNTLFHPLGYVSLLGIPIVLLAVPGLLVNMLSSDPTMFSGFYQYSAEIVPFVVVSAAIGTAALSGTGTRLRAPFFAALAPSCCFLVLIAAVVDTHLHGFSQVADGFSVPSVGSHQKLENRLIRRVPPNAVVAAADEILPHLSDRTWAYLLPTIHPANGPQAQYIVLDASQPSLPVQPRTIHAVAAFALRHGFGIAEARDGILVLRRGSQQTTLPPDFYSFLYSSSSVGTPVRASWDHLHLQSVLVHSHGGTVTTSRPDIHVESFWRCTGPLEQHTHIAFYLSPVYAGTHPAFNTAWQSDSDSAAWDWLPVGQWPCTKTVRAESLSLVPPMNQSGSVDVAIDVQGAGDANKLSGVTHVSGAPDVVRIATVSVRP